MLWGGNSGEKENFLANYLNVTLTPTHKTTVLLHSPQTNQTILPATALDVDFRYPFYRISQKLEQIQKGEGEKINTHLEMKTANSSRLQGKLFIDIPNFIHATNYEVTNLLNNYSLEQSDIVLVFCDVFNTTADLTKALISTLRKQQDSNKFIYLFDDTTANAAAWQKKLADLGLTIGQFIGISQLKNEASSEFELLEQRLANAGLQRSYRVLRSLEKSIRDVENVVIHEVKIGILNWKETSTFSSLVVLGLFAMLAVFAEVAGMGFLELLFDPIIGSVIILITVAFMVPTHILFSKILAKLTIHSLAKRQKQLHLTENLVTLFEQNLIFSRMMLPISEPLGWDKKTKAKLDELLNKTRELVQSLNDNFSAYTITAAPRPVVQVVAPAPKPVVVETPVFEQPVAPVFVEPAPVIIQTPPSVQITAPTQVVFEQPAVSTPNQQPADPAKKSALMQKFARK